MDWINNEMIYLIPHFLVVALLLRSVFFLIKAKKGMDKKNFWIMIIPLIAGIGFLIEQTSNLESMSKRFPFMIIFLMGAANAFYMLAKEKKENVFSLHRLIKKELTFSKKEEKTLNILAFSKKKPLDEAENVSWDDFSVFNINRLYVSKNGKEAIIKRSCPFNLTHFFNAYLKMGGVFTPQFHSNADEYIRVDSGKIKCLVTNKIYIEGDVIRIKANEIHSFEGIYEYSSLSVYITKV
jgi:hypothetical protein